MKRHLSKQGLFIGALFIGMLVLLSVLPNAILAHKTTSELINYQSNEEESVQIEYLSYERDPKTEDIIVHSIVTVTSAGPRTLETLRFFAPPYKNKLTPIKEEWYCRDNVCFIDAIFDTSIIGTEGGPFTAEAVWDDRMTIAVTEYLDRSTVPECGGESICE